MTNCADCEFGVVVTRKLLASYGEVLECRFNAPACQDGQASWPRVEDSDSCEKGRRKWAK